MITTIAVPKSGKLSLKSLFPHKDVSSVCYYRLDKTSKGDVVLRLYDMDGALIKDLPSGKLRATKPMLRMVKQASQSCYDRAKNKVLSKNKNMKDSSAFKDLVDEEYRKNLCKLETDVLEAIIFMHNKRKMLRMNITINVIKSELANRVLLNDSSRTK